MFWEQCSSENILKCGNLCTDYWLYLTLLLLKMCAVIRLSSLINWELSCYCNYLVHLFYPYLLSFISILYAINCLFYPYIYFLLSERNLCHYLRSLFDWILCLWCICLCDTNVLKMLYCRYRRSPVCFIAAS